MARLLLAAAAWCGVATLVVLSTRVLAYALAPPTLLALDLDHSAGGPRLVVVALVAIGLALVVAAGIVGGAAIAVREQLALEERVVYSPPRFRIGRATARFAALMLVCLTVFALLESYIHWRAGLGWHGIHCLTGPVHRNAIPIVIALSLIAIALVEAVEHLLAWARRTFALLFLRLHVPQFRDQFPAWTAQIDFPQARLFGGDRPRGPPRSPFVFLAA